ncbi:AsmA family protein [Rhizobium sp. RU36D]|uniref:AsmA family protein n=1 Tax=Rhizobium sp. RU36D TaxID=1907415 RepID=UPI0009D8B355|nr:AsmA family protein [Rhizobium sp. RU36D]SMC58377.1 Uncharacterized protein involved in outer membrane biogenesis [Rhizobium sp. RU36D]
MVGRFLVFLGGIVVVALFAALLAPLFVDWTDFRRNFEDQASRILGKKVTVIGSVDARILPFPSVTLHDVTVGRDDDGSPLVHVERFSMDAELAPFLSGEARIFDMRIEDPRVRIRLLPDGTLDWMRGGRPEIPARTVVLEKVHVTGGVVEFIDDQSRRTRRITNLNADMSAGSLAGPWTASGNAVVDGEAGSFHLSSLQPNEVTGAVPLKLRLLPDTRPFTLDLDGELAIAEGRPGYKGNFQAQWTGAMDAPADGAKKPAPSIKGGFELANDRIRVPDYRLELGTPDNPYAVTGEATLDTGRAPEFLLTAEGQQIDVNRIDSDGTNGKTGRDPAVSVRQRLNRLISLAAAVPIPEVPGRASLSLPAIVAGDTVIRDIKLDVRPAGNGWTVENAVAILPGRTQVEAKGWLDLQGEPSFSGEMLAASTQPSGLSAWLSGQVDPAIRQLNSAGFSALVSLTPELQRFEKLELSVGADQLKGRVERQAFANAMPNLSFDLTGNSLDINAMRALATLFSGEDASDSLFDHQIAARLKVGKLSAFGTEARDVDTVFSIGESGLSVTKLNIGDLAGAAIKVSGRAEGALLSYSGAGDISFSAFDPGPFIAMLRKSVGDHPVLQRMEQNAGWYTNTALNGRIQFGEEQGGGLSGSIKGTSNGSRVDATFRQDDLVDLMGTSAARLELAVDNPTPSILLGQAGLSPLPFDGDGAGRLILTLDRLGGMDESGGIAGRGQLSFATGMTTLTAEGDIKLDATEFLQGAGKVTVDSADIEPYLLMNGIVLPQQGSGLSVKAAADVSADAQTVTVANLAATAAGNAISGEIKLDRASGLTKGNGAIALDDVDLAWLAELVLGPLTDPATGELSATELPTVVPANSDFHVDLTARRFHGGSLGTVADLTGTLNVKDGAVALEDAKGKWRDGTVSGRLSLVNAEGSGLLQGRLSVANGDIATLYPSAETAVATGRFDLISTIEGSGKTVREVLGAVNGSGELRLNGLGVNTLDLDLFGPLLAEADRLQQEITPENVEPMLAGLIGGRRTELGNVVVPFNISAGVARAQNIVAGNAGARTSTDVRLSLASGEVDAAVTVDLAAGEEALAGADPSFRMLFKGDVTSPQRSFDIAELTNFLSLRAFERERRRVETLQANVLEKQRLRREVALYRFEERQRQAAREKAEAEAQARLAEEARLEAERAARAAEEAAQAAERAKVDEAQRLKDEAAAKAAAEAEAKQRAADEAAKRLADEEAARRAAPTLPAAGAAGTVVPDAAENALPPEPATTQSVPNPPVPVPPREKVTRGGALPPVPLTFEGLPGVR